MTATISKYNTYYFIQFSDIINKGVIYIKDKTGVIVYQKSINNKDFAFIDLRVAKEEMKLIVSDDNKYIIEKKLI